MPKGMQGFQEGNKNYLKHGCSNPPTKTYRIWCGMRKRCNNPNLKIYKYYGGRGILVCERWNSFENFLADMGECPENLIMDRINNNGNYKPANCRWVDIKTSNRNRSWVKLSVEKANKIRELYSEGYKQHKIAELFNVSHQMINCIINRKNWN